MKSRYMLKSAAMALLLLVSGQSPAIADNQQDYCIKCTNPNETYICRISSNSSQTQGKQLLCIMNIAREHGHDSCAATTEAHACSGVLVQYKVNGSGMPQAPVEKASTIPAHEQPPVAPVDATKKEPETLVEFTKQAGTATKKSLQSASTDTGNAIKNTGKAISDTGSQIGHFTGKVGSNIKKATTTTLKCITSLFSNCN